jgi:hypothetical protein
MRGQKLPFVLSAFAIGFVAFEAVTVFARYPKTFLYEVIDGMAMGDIDYLLGEKFLQAHLYLEHALASAFNGICLAIPVFLISLLPKIGRRGAVCFLIFLALIDVAFLVALFPDPDAGRYLHWLYTP